MIPFTLVIAPTADMKCRVIDSRIIAHLVRCLFGQGSSLTLSFSFRIRKNEGMFFVPHDSGGRTTLTGESGRDLKKSGSIDKIWIYKRP
jgi:hypothetical protein